MTTNESGEQPGSAVGDRWEDGGTVELGAKEGGVELFPYLIKRKSLSGWPIAVARTPELRDAIIADHEQATWAREVAKPALERLAGKAGSTDEDDAHQAGLDALASFPVTE